MDRVDSEQNRLWIEQTLDKADYGQSRPWTKEYELQQILKQG